MSLAIIRRSIIRNWPDIVARANVRPEALDALPNVPRILGSGTKTEKGEGKGYLTAVVYMSPATEAFEPGDGRTLCPRSTHGCASACLGAKAGRMVMRPVKLSRLWKATLYLGDRQLWRLLVRAELTSFERRAARKGLRPVVRIDGSTDTGEGAGFAPEFPEIQFYDYTKVSARAAKWARGGYAANYHLTFSFSGANAAASQAALSAGVNVAAVFSTGKGEALPAWYDGSLTGCVIDGDVTDLRFLDPSDGQLVGLRFKAAKGRTVALEKAMAEGFVLPA